MHVKRFMIWALPQLAKPLYKIGDDFAAGVSQEALGLDIVEQRMFLRDLFLRQGWSRRDVCTDLDIPLRAFDRVCRWRPQKPTVGTPATS